MGNVLVIGDLHIANLFRLLNSRDSGRKLYDDAFNEIIEKATREGSISDVVLLGDLIGGTTKDIEANGYECTGILLNFIKKLSEISEQIHIISGNHDKVRGETENYGTISLFEVIKNTLSSMDKVRLYKTPTAVTLACGVEASMLPYPYTKPLTQPGTFVFSHIDPYKCWMQNGELHKELIVDNESYLWHTGHIHIYESDDFKNTIVGSVFCNSVKETHDPRVLLIKVRDLNGTNLITDMSIELENRVFVKKIMLSDESDLDGISEELSSLDSSENADRTVVAVYSKDTKLLSKMRVKTALKNITVVFKKQALENSSLEKQETELKRVGTIIQELTSMESILRLYLKEVKHLPDMDIDNIINIIK